MGKQDIAKVQDGSVSFVYGSSISEESIFKKMVVTDGNHTATITADIVDGDAVLQIK